MRELNGDWKDLFRLFRVSLHIPKLLLSACGLILSFLTFMLLTMVSMSGSEELTNLLPNITHVDNVLLTAFEIPVLSLQMLFSSPMSILQILLLLAVTIVILVGIWSYIGNAIARIAALEITRDERIEVNEALSYTSDQFKAAFMSFFLPLIGFAIFWIVVWLFALLANIPIVNIGVMAVLPLALLGGFIMTLIFVGTAGGFPLFIPSIAVEGTDSFDAISRGFSYVLSRAWHYIWHWLVALAYGGVCTLFVLAFAWMIQSVVNFAGSAAINENWLFEFDKVLTVNLKDVTWTTWGAGIVYYFWIFIFQTLSFGFAISFFFCASTMIYLLMRKRVDGIDMEEVYEELDDDEELLFEEDEAFEDEPGEESDLGESPASPPEEEDETPTDDEDADTAKEGEGGEEESSDEEGDASETDEENEEEEEELYDCPEPDCDRQFDTEFGRDQHHRMMHEDDDEE